MSDDSIVTVYSEFDDNQEIYCPHCKSAQAEHPINILMETIDGTGEWECDVCKEEFTLMSTQLIEYVTSK